MENNVFASFVSASDAQILSAVFYGRCQTWLFEGEKGEIEQFVRRWFPFTHKTLLRILEEGTRKERVCALFSLGQLGYEADRPLLRTYLQSAEEWERWASAIVLWKQREKQAFFVLRSLVCDELEFIERSRHLSQEETIEFDLWSAITRRQAIFTLAWEGSAEVIALFSRTLEKCWERERSLDELLERWETVQNEFFGLEDTLVYLLGQWHVWPPVLQRPLPAGRLRIAQVLWTLGRLHAHETFPIVHRLLTSPLLLFRILTSLTEKNASQYPISLSPSFAERESDRSERRISISTLKAALTHHFGFSPERGDDLLTQFPKDCLIRLKETRLLSLALNEPLSLSEVRQRWIKDVSLTGKAPDSWSNENDADILEDFDTTFDPSLD